MRSIISQQGKPISFSEPLGYSGDAGLSIYRYRKTRTFEA